MRRILSVLLIVLATIGPGVSAATAAELLSSANQLYDRWSGEFDYDAYQLDLESSIALYQDLLDHLSPDDVEMRMDVLIRLSKACFELGEGYLTSPREVESIHEQGRDYALAALRLDPEFVSAEQHSFRAALSGATDVRAIFWYGNNLGRYLEFHRLTAITGGVRDVQACFDQAVELDPTYLDGGPVRSLASFHSQVPGFLGGDRERAQELHQQAMTMGSAILENAVNWAEYGLHGTEDRQTYCRVLQDVITQSDDRELMAAWPFYNERAARRAKDLLAGSSCGS